MMEPDVKHRNQRNRRRERAQRMQAQREIKVKNGDSGEDGSPAREKPLRPPTRRKKSKEPLGEEDIIDGFAIMAFRTYEDLEAAIKCATSTRKETLTTSVKPRVISKNAVVPEIVAPSNKEKEANAPNAAITLLNDAGTSDDSGRASERHTGSSGPPRDPDSSRDRLSDASSRCSSGKGYICDSEGDDEKASPDNSRNGSPRFHDNNEDNAEGGAGAFLASGGGGAIAISRTPAGGSASPAPAPLPHPAPSPAPAALPPAALPTAAPPTAATAPDRPSSPTPAPPAPSPLFNSAAYPSNAAQGDYRMYRMTDHDARTKRPPSIEAQTRPQSPPLNLQNNSKPASPVVTQKSVQQPQAPHPATPAVSQPNLPAAYAGRPAHTPTAPSTQPLYATHPNGLPGHPNGGPPHLGGVTLPHLNHNGYPNHIAAMHHHQDTKPSIQGSPRQQYSHHPPHSVQSQLPPLSSTASSHPYYAAQNVMAPSSKHSVQPPRTSTTATSAPQPIPNYMNSHHPPVMTTNHTVPKNPPINFSISNHLNHINHMPQQPQQQQPQHQQHQHQQQHQQPLQQQPYLNHSISNHIIPSSGSNHVNAHYDPPPPTSNHYSHTSPASSKSISNVSHLISNHIGENNGVPSSSSVPSPVTTTHSNSHTDFRAASLISNQSSLRTPTPTKEMSVLPPHPLGLNGYPPHPMSSYPPAPYPSLYAPYASSSPYVPTSIPSPRNSTETKTSSSASPLMTSKAPSKPSSSHGSMSHPHPYSPRGPSPLREREGFSNSSVSSLPRASSGAAVATSLAPPAIPSVAPLVTPLAPLPTPLAAAPTVPLIAHSLASVPTIPTLTSVTKPPAHWGVSSTPSGASLFPAPLPPPPNPHPFSAESLFQTSPSADLIRRELDSRFLAAAGAAPPPPSAPGVSLRTEMHHHQHQHTHVHQHPAPPPVPPAAPPQHPAHHLYAPPPPTAHHPHLLKDVGKMPMYRGGLAAYGPYTPGLLPTSPFLAPAQLPAFAPKPLAIGVDPTKPTRPTPTKTGKWNAMHVRIAWEIQNHHQKGAADKEKRTLTATHYAPPPYMAPHPLSLAGVSPFARYGAGGPFPAPSPFAFPTASSAYAAEWRQRAEERARRERNKSLLERSSRPRSPLRNGDKERMPPAPQFAPPPPIPYDPYRGMDPLQHMRFAPYVEAAIRAEEERAKILSAYAKVPTRPLPPAAPPPNQVHHLDLMKKEEPR